jgi:site-specific recombinase XerD
MLDFDSEIKKFVQVLSLEANYSKNTTEAYKNDLKQFNLFLTKHKILSLNQIENRHLTQYALELSGYQTRSVSRKLSTLKSFFNYLFQEKLIDKNLSSWIELPKKEKPLPKANAG